jgi:acetolactate synthase-1/2/3 large subunit
MEEELLSTADGVLAVGLDPVELLPRAWRADLPVVAVAEYRPEQQPFEASCEVIGDLPAALDALREALPPGGGWDLADWAGRGGEFKARTRKLLANASTGRGRSGVPPHRVVEIAREIFPGGPWSRWTPAPTHFGRRLLGQLRAEGLSLRKRPGSAGYALATAIAAKLVAPDRTVLAFMGDGGFLRSVADLATAAWQRLPQVGVVFVDGSRSHTRVQQEQKRYAPVGVSLGEMDIPKLAESLGALATEVEDEEGLRSALKDALSTTTQPAVIAVRVRPTGYRRMLEILQGKAAG